MKKIQPLDFVPDRMFVHSGYSAVNKMALPSDVHIDVIGLDTDACVLSHCFDLFDKDIPFHVLIDGCYSSGGAEMHDIGVKILQRQFNNAVDTVTKLDDVVKAQKVVSRDYLNNK